MAFYKKIVSGCILLAAVFSCAEAAIECGDYGVITFPGGGSIVPRHFDEKWDMTGLDARTYRPEVKKSDGSVSFTGAWKVSGGRFSPELAIEMNVLPGGERELRYRVESAAEIPTNSLAVEFLFPVKAFSGHPIRIDHVDNKFPQEIHKGTHYLRNETSLVRVTGPERVLEIAFAKPCRLRIIDNRQYSYRQFYSIRIDFPGNVFPLKGKHELVFRVKESLLPVTRPLDITRAANMGFADEIDNDGKGGWSDQGPENDMRSLPLRKLSVPPVEFLIADPAGNNGKSAIVLGGGGRPNLPRRVELPLNGEALRSLFLLQAYGWSNNTDRNIGYIIARYRDGGEQRIPVRIGQDLNNWWAPVPTPNGLVAWRGRNPSNTIGLYRSGFELEGRPLKSLVFESTGTGIWMIAAVSGSAGFLPLPDPPAEEFIQTASADWRELKNEREVIAGSALDFSFLLDAPAGKHGFIRTTPSGHFRFEKQDKPVRFYGTNLVFWAHYISPGQMDILAERLGRIGYNAVRFHHFDRDLVDRRNIGPAVIRPDRQEMLDYLVYALKKRGLYITLDLYTTRFAPKGTFRSFPGELTERDYKLAAMLLPEVNADVKSFAGQLLTHVNPHTGLRWADDPAFIGLSLINENTIFHIINHGSGDAIKKVYREKFTEWCREQALAVTDDTREEEFRRFLGVIYDRYYADMKKFIRELGVKMPLTDQNFIMSPNQTRQRNAYDYVDNHLYWDHPTAAGQGGLPLSYHNQSVLSRRLNVPADMAPTRIFGKPFTVSEFNYCRPNPFRAEGAPIFAAFAAQQDWDALYRFAYSHSNIAPFESDMMFSGIGFDTANDPVQLLTERLAAAFFTRGDVQVGKMAFPVAVSPLDYKNYQPRYPASVQELMFFGRVGSVLDTPDGDIPALPSGSRALFKLDPRLKYSGELPLLTETNAKKMMAELTAHRLIPTESAAADGESIKTPEGELRADFRAGTFVAATPKSEALVAPEGKTLKGDRLCVENLTGFSVTGAVALDGKTLDESGRVLLIHVSDVAQGGVKYQTSARDVILDFAGGKGPILARRAVSRITLQTKGNRKLYALDIVGRRICEVPFSLKDGSLTFTADTFGDAGIVFAYELVR